MVHNIGKAVVLVLLFSTLSFAGSITGTISFKGAKPASQEIKMNSDAKCMNIHKGQKVMSEQVTVNPNNTLRWVFVSIKKGLEGKKFNTPVTKVTINQEGCTYHPHVLGVMVNQNVEIVNNDPTMHNIHSQAKNTKQFNLAQPMKGQKNMQKFTAVEKMVKVKCDVHSWMGAYVGVVDNPFYAVSDDKGTFTIKDLPAGEYEIEAWHETLGSQTMKVSVGASDSKKADFTFQGK